MHNWGSEYYPAGVESAEALGNFHSTTGTAAGRADSGRVGGSREGIAWRLQQGPGAQPGSSDPAGWGSSQVHLAFLTSTWPTLGYQPRRPSDDKDGYISVPQRQTWGLLLHPLPCSNIPCTITFSILCNE